MRLVEDGPPDKTGTSRMNGKIPVVQVGEEESSDDEDIEEMEPVSATLVLRVLSEPPPSPSVSRKSSTRRNQPPHFLDTEDIQETFLQVQVQRSTSSSSLSGRAQSRSRPASTTPSFYVTEPEDSWQLAIRDGHRDTVRELGVSRDTSRESSVSPDSSLYGPYSLDTHKHKMSPVEMIQRVSQHTRAMETGLKELRQELDSPTRLLDVGQETVVLSGLNKQAADSLKHIKNLYDETKYLKTYLEKLEAKVHYDMVMKKASPSRPPWYRRLLFICLLGGITIYTWHRIDPQGCETKLAKVGESSLGLVEELRTFVTADHSPTTDVVLN